MRKLPILLLAGCVLNLRMPAAVAQTLENSSPAQLRHLVQQGRADTNRVQALLWLSDFYLSKEGASGQDLDSARVVAQQAAALSRRLAYAHGQDWAAFKTGQTYIAQHAAGRVLTIAKSLRDTSRIKLLLALAQNQFDERFAQNARPDSALALFRQATTLSQALGQRAWQEKSLFQLGTCYMRLQEVAPGKACFQQVIEANQRAGDKAGELKAWYLLGASYAHGERPQPKYFAAMRACFQAALALAHQTHNREYEALTRMQLALIHFVEGKSAQAEDELRQVVAMQKAIGYKEVYYTYNYLSDISRSRGYLNRSLSYTLQVIKSLEEVGKVKELDYIYYKVAESYFTFGQTQKAIDALNKSLAISHQKGQVANRYVLGALTRLMALALVKQGKAREALLFVQDIARRKVNADPRDNALLDASFADCYGALKNYPLAERYYLHGLAVGKQLDPWYLANIRTGLSRMYVAAGQYAKAEPYLRQLAAAPAGQISAASLQSVHLLSFKVDSAQGRYLAAIGHLQQREALKDSLFSKTKTQQLEELQVQFETKEKEQNILLLTEKGLRQQNELRQAQTTRNATIGGAVLLLLLLGLGYNRYRLKQRSNLLLEAQQLEINHKNDSLERLVGEKQDLLEEKDWMLKEIHHRVKNNLQIINSLLTTQAAYLLEPTALEALRESQNRVQAIALVHQKLYQSDSVARVNMQEYIQEITELLLESFDISESVRPQLDVALVELDVALAIPLGLIINEAITNTLKHAFPPPRTGTLTIQLRPIEALRYELRIADDGVGLPPGFDPARAESLGLTMIMGLSRQLGGVLHLTPQAPGAQLILHFEAARKPLRDNTLA
jgi:two-component sensor histidine kinase/tetratricopeptide (TPR) repeat protein